jgi:putative flippase GtrA
MSWLQNGSRVFSLSVFRFLAVGVLNTLIGLSVIFSLKWLAGMNDFGANFIGYAVGLTVSYFLNGRWTFLFRGSMYRAAPRFALTTLVAYLANLATVICSIRLFGLNDYLAQALGTVPYTVLSFLGSRYFVFVDGPSQTANQ